VLILTLLSLCHGRRTWRSPMSGLRGARRVRHGHRDRVHRMWDSGDSFGMADGEETGVWGPDGNFIPQYAARLRLGQPSARAWHEPKAWRNAWRRWGKGDRAGVADDAGDAGAVTATMSRARRHGQGR
jgi:hypothetical protein